MKITLIDKLPKFLAEIEKTLDRSLNRMAIDIERLSKQQVPVLHGQLRSSGHHERAGYMNYIIFYNKEYARFQEFGGDGKRVVKKYTKPGTKAFYLKDPGDIISEKALSYFKQELEKVKI